MICNGLRALAALLLAAAVPGHAQTPPSADCGDDDGVDRCNPAVQARVRASFDVAPIEQLDREGATVLRSFFVDGYGNDQPPITFIGRREAGPELIVNWPGAPEMRPPVPLDRWHDMITAARYFDRDLVPLPKDEDDFGICLHSWVVTAEAAGLSRESKGVRRKTQDSCNDGLAAALGFAMADAAMELLPDCQVLRSDQHRNAVTRLAACTQLQGDRVAAARKAKGRSFWPKRFVGETADRVHIEGLASEVPGDDYAKRREGKAVQIWTREYGSESFRLRSMTVEPLVAAPAK